MWLNIIMANILSCFESSHAIEHFKLVRTVYLCSVATVLMLFVMKFSENALIYS